MKVSIVNPHSVSIYMKCTQTNSVVCLLLVVLYSFLSGLHKTHITWQPKILNRREKRTLQNLDNEFSTVISNAN